MASVLHLRYEGWALLRASIVVAAALLAATSANAQDWQPESQSSYSTGLNAPFQGSSPRGISSGEKTGTVATSAVGTAGQRLETGQGAANIKPMARLDTRIANRVQSRIRNRIDRYYDPAANATSPFKIAADQTRPNVEVSR